MGKYKDDEAIYSAVPKGVKARLLSYEGKLENIPPTSKPKKGRASVGVSLIGGKDGYILHESKYETDQPYLGERADIVIESVETGRRQVKAVRYTVGHRANINDTLKAASSLGEKKKLVKEYRIEHPVKGRAKSDIDR
jgi:hypothetical protein